MLMGPVRWVTVGRFKKERKNRRIYPVTDQMKEWQPENL